MRKRKSQISNREYVVGWRKDGFCWLVPRENESAADDQNLEAARRYGSLADAVRASEEHAANVFEIVSDNGQESLRELLVDLSLTASVPFDGCYLVTPSFLAGPAFLRQSDSTTASRLIALRDGQVRSVVSLIDRAELFSMAEQLDHLPLEALFRQFHFPVTDGHAPTLVQMRTILDLIDQELGANRKVFLHCHGGRGRTGTVVGCWLARHGIALGRAALDELARLRYVHGLFKPSPETDAQRQLVINWKKGA